MLPATSLAAVVLGLMFVALTANAARTRGRERVAVGPGSDRLLRAVRAQGNFAETTPMVLILSALAEANGTPAVIVAAVDAMFAVGRVAHAFSLMRAEVAPRPEFRFRIVGMSTTFAAIVFHTAAILVCLVLV